MRGHFVDRHRYNAIQAAMLYLVGAISGAVWGALAWWIGHDLSASRLALASGCAASPFIGIVTARLVAPLRGLDVQGALIISAGLLYGTSWIFGLAVGIASAFSGDFPLLSGISGVLSVALTIPLGITLSGLVVALWPLALVNCLLVWRVQPQRAEDGA